MRNPAHRPSGRSFSTLNPPGISALPLLAVVLLLAGVAMSPGASPTATVQVDYTAPGFVIPDHGTLGAISASANFTYTYNGTGIRTLFSQFQLLDESGNAVPIRNPDEAAGAGGDSLVQLWSSKLYPSGSDITINIEFLPDEALDPDEKYRVRLVQVVDVSNPLNGVDLGKSATELLGNTFVHFHDGATEVVRLRSATFSKPYRVRAGATSAQRGLGFTPKVDLYRYDPDAPAAKPSFSLMLDLRNDLGTLITNTSVTAKLESLIGSTDGAGGPASVTDVFVEGREVIFTPAPQLDPVNRTYDLEVGISGTAGRKQMAGVRIFDFTGSLAFGSIATTFTALESQPPDNGPSGIGRGSAIDVPVGAASIDGADGHTFGDGTPLTVTVDAGGNATYTGAGSVAVSGPAQDDANKNDISFTRSNITLGTTGATAGTILVRLPAGVGYRPDKSSLVYRNSISLSSVPLGQDLSPGATSLDLGIAGGYLHEESKPVIYSINDLDWETAGGVLVATAVGVESLRKVKLADLASASADLADPAAAFKASNDHVYNGVNSILGGEVEIGVDPDGSGAVWASLNLAADSFHPHMPYADPVDPNQAIGHAGGLVNIQGDQPGAGSQLNGVAAFEVPYDRACVDNPRSAISCGAAGDVAMVSVSPDGGSLEFTRDGGLQSGAAVLHKLKWGKDPNSANYAHIVETNFDRASYLMAGSSLSGGISATEPRAAGLGQWMGVGAILYSGVDPGLADTIRPDTAAYDETDNLIADYPGVTFRVADIGAMDAKSRLAGADTPLYPLAQRGQYYVRRAGVSGIHQADAFDEALTLYGYDVKLTSLQFSYLDNLNEDSLTNGNVTIPAPSNFIVDFSSLKLTCPGGLETATVENASPLELEYWANAPLEPLAMRFESDNGCDPSVDACLVLAVEARAELFEQKLAGEMGFRPSGHIATRDNEVGTQPEFDSRLKLPTVPMPGPGNQTYTFTPSQDAYFNDAAAANAPASGSGFLCLFGTVDVPFFEDLKWNVHTRGVYTGSTPLLYSVASGWSDGGETGFDNIFFDTSHRGFPAATNPAAYRASSVQGGTYAVQAKQSWLGIPNAFEYDLKWDESGKAFSSLEVSKAFYTFELEHRAKFLSPEMAEITFGVAYDGVPNLNLAGFAADRLDDAVGYTSNIIDSVGREAADTLLDGIDAGKDMIASEAEDLLAPIIDGPLMTAVDEFLDDLYNLPGALDDKVNSADAAALVASKIRGAAGPLQTSIDQAFAQSGAGSVQDTVDNNVAKLQQAIGTLNAPSTGMLQTNGVKKLMRSVVADQAPEFIGVVAGEIAGAAFDEFVNTPGLEEIRESLDQVDGQLDEVRSAITDGANGLADQIAAVTTPVNLQAIADGVADTVEEEFGRYKLSDFVELPQIPRVQLRALIRQAILDELLGSQILDVLQKQLREYVQDAVAVVQKEIDSGIQQINSALREVIATHLAEVDQQINQEIVGPLSDLIGAGRLTGYAHINGDSLTELRVDGKFRFKVPEKMDFEGYLLIKQLTSDNRGGCIPPGTTVNEITIGANKVPLEWISSGLKANVGVKFSISSSLPVGLGGYFDMVGGPLDFESFKINDIKAALAFGAIPDSPFLSENYLAAAVDLEFSDYGLKGGMMFGRICTLDPLILIDPEVAAVLGDPPFTGAYVYGEARLPINELIGIPSSCLLKVVVGAGAGAFYFAEGPTYGGKLVGEVKGEAICLVSISGRMALVGARQGNGPMKFNGNGKVKGKAGACPFCVKFNKSVKVSFQIADGEIKSPSIDY
jgi:hypothetical protein